MQQYSQVTGGGSSLTLYRESHPGVVDNATKGVRLAFMSESFKTGTSKKQSSIIRNVRGPGKPFAGLPEMSGGLEAAAYAPQIGHLLRALCGAPTTSAVGSVTLKAAEVICIDAETVGLPCPAHGFVQDAVITIAGTTNYDGTYRVEPGTTADVIAISTSYVAETLAAGAKVYRGRAAFLIGAAAEVAPEKVRLHVEGGIHALNPGESITVSGTTSYDGTYVLQEGSVDGVLVIIATFVDETFTGLEVAAPVFWKHEFKLPRKQPSVTVEKFFNFESGAAANPYRRFSYCKVNGFSFQLGGDEELKVSLDFAVGKETPAPAPLDANPEDPPAINLYNIEAAIWVAGKRRGDVETANITSSYGVEPGAALGDRGQYTRMPEGDPDCKCAMTCFLETDELQRVTDASSTIPVAISVCAITGEEFWWEYPEAELDSDGPSISGKQGIKQDFTAMAFVDKTDSILRSTIINRVASYA